MGEACSGELVHYESLKLLKFYILHLSGRFVIFPHVGVIPINPIPKLFPLHQWSELTFKKMKKNLTASERLIVKN